MRNNAFFNIVFYNNTSLQYDSSTIITAIDSTNYKDYSRLKLDTEIMITELRLMDTLHFGLGKMLPDIFWENEFVIARTQNYYNALLKVICPAIKAGVIKRANLFYPFVRSSMINPELHGSTITTFLTEVVFPDNTSIFMITEEIPDDFYSTVNSDAAYSLAESTLFHVRHSSWFYTKYKYHYTEDIDTDNLIISNYILSELLEINFHINLDFLPSQIIISSMNCNIINKQTYNQQERLNLILEDNIVFLPCNRGNGFDLFAYHSYKKTLSFILENYLENSIIKYSSLHNCVSLPIRLFLKNSSKYILVLLKKLNIPISKEIHSIIEAINRDDRSRNLHEVASIGGTFLGATINQNIEK